MFSRIIALQKGSVVAKLWQPQMQRGTFLAAIRCSTSDSSEVAKIDIQTRIKNWDEANKLYYGPERDMKNFPVLRQAETPPPSRLGFIPASWFDAMYEKTGVTGPYVLGGGFITFLLSKELWVVEHMFTEFVCFWTAMIIIVKKWGPSINEYFLKYNKDFNQKYWYQPKIDAKASSEKTIVEVTKTMEQQEGQKYLFEAKRENVDLQLEAIYRKRLADIHHAVKRKLDFQYEIESAKTRFEQSHMVNWIVNNVMKSITPQQERDSITRCIQDLKALSARA